jgi:predicted transcriptional regulator
MRTMRVELRTLLKWMLTQETFTVASIAERGGNQSTTAHNLKRLKSLGLISRDSDKRGHAHVWHVSDVHRATELANQELTEIGWKAWERQKKHRAELANPKPFINSVWSLGL